MDHKQIIDALAAGLIVALDQMKRDIIAEIRNDQSQLDLFAQVENGIETRIMNRIDERFNDYDPTTHDEFDNAVERIISDHDFGDEINEELSNVTFEVSVSSNRRRRF